jgi:hypothetical protein
MKKVVVILFLGFLSQQGIGQNNGSDVVEGGKLLLELVKIVKPDKAASTNSKSGDCKKDKTSDLAFDNKKQGVIKVVLTDKDQSSAKQELVIQAQKKEYFLSLVAKVYTCEVTDVSTGTIIRKGDIRLSVCEHPEVIIE